MNFCFEVIAEGSRVDEVFGAVQTVVLCKARLVKVHLLIQKRVRVLLQIQVDLKWHEKISLKLQITETKTNTRGVQI